MLKHILSGLFCLALGAASTAIAAPDDHAAENAARQLVETMQPQQGQVALPGGIATLDLPAGVNPLGNDGWGVVVTYDKDGHVKDDDADGIDYNNLLKDMQEGLAAANEERKKQGYAGMRLAGWAETPHYDKAAHKLYWAKDLVSEDSGHHGLNYNIRVLGREGVLVLNAVADMSQLGQIKDEMQQVTAFTNFTSGNRYADFNDKTDKVAEYGIAALVAGGVAAKLGLFAKLAALLLAFKKLIIVAFAAAGSAIWKFFKRKPKVQPEPAPAKVDLSK